MILQKGEGTIGTMSSRLAHSEPHATTFLPTGKNSWERRLRSSAPFITPLSLVLMIACGSGQTEPAAPGSESSSIPADTRPSSEEGTAAASTADEGDTWEEGDEKTPLATTPSTDHEAREVLYRVSPNGLKVQIEGSEFIPTAKAIKIDGRWGVQLSVTASTDAERALLSPSGGPLAFGGQVNRGKVEKFGDKREGSEIMTLDTDGPVTFTRTWPAEGEKGLAPGESLELQVGLWGLGPDAETMAPVRRFIVVKMTADTKGAEATIQPPAN